MNNRRQVARAASSPLRPRRPPLGYADLVYRLDRVLQRRIGVFEFTDDPDVLFRAALGHMDGPVLLTDGVRLAAGDPVLDLHLWNEQIPLISAAESPVSWGKTLQRRLRHSLLAVSRFLAQRSDLRTVLAIRADMALGVAAQSEHLRRLSGRYGFEPLPGDGHADGGRLKRFGENILTSMLVLARNPQTFRKEALLRARVPIIMSRQKLERLYPPNPADSHIGREL